MQWSRSHHYVLLMDIMGFKDKVYNIPHYELEDILITFQTKNNKIKPLLNSASGGELMRISHFSDSIIIATFDAGKKSLNRLIKAAAILMRNALESGIALRGVISKGLLTFDKDRNLYFGKPIVDAHLLEGQINLYGIIVHHTAEEDIKELVKNPLTNRDRKVKYIPIMRADVPFKNGLGSHYCVAYHLINSQLHEENVTDETIRLIEALYPTVSGEPRVYVDHTIKCLSENQLICN